MESKQENTTKSEFWKELACEKAQRQMWNKKMKGSRNIRELIQDEKLCRLNEKILSS